MLYEKNKPKANLFISTLKSRNYTCNIVIYSIHGNAAGGKL